MGRSVQIEAAVQGYAESCVQSRVAAEVGALVGRYSPGKDLVLQAVRAPDRDDTPPVTITAGGAASKKGGSSKGGKAAGAGGLQLDDEWVVEHAAMVERLLPGGLDVVGFYVLCPAAAFAAAAGLLAALADAACKELSARLPSLLVLHIDSVSGGLALREAAGGTGGGTLRPAELKLAPGLTGQMATLQSRFSLEVQLPVAESAQELQAAFQAAVDTAAQQLRGCLGLVAGQLATADCQLTDLLDASGGGGSSSGGGGVDVELLLQPASSLAFSAAGGGKAGSGLQRGRAEGSSLGLASLCGVLDCRACVHRREPAAAAVEAVAADVRRSLQARLDALLDAAEQQQEAAVAGQQPQQPQAAAGAAAVQPAVHPLFAAAGGSAKPLTVALPRRAFVAAAAAGGVPYCDYLFEGEGTQALLGRLQMLLPMPELARAAVDCLETAAAPSAHRAAAGSKAQAGGGQTGGGGSSRTAGALPCTLLAAGSVAAGVLALALGYLSLSGGPH